jgi:hypothetical protein
LRATGAGIAALRCETADAAAGIFMANLVLPFGRENFPAARPGTPQGRRAPWHGQILQSRHAEITGVANSFVPTSLL